MNSLIETIAARTGASKKAASLGLGNLGSAIAVVLAEHGECRIPGVGTLKVTERAARTGRTPKTGEPVEIPAKRVLKFRPAKELKTAIG
ncbi:MAG: HU family DNA-binding protein [Pseudomonadota bacterium]